MGEFTLHNANKTVFMTIIRNKLEKKAANPQH